MKKKSWLQKITNHFEISKNAPCATIYKAAVAYLYGDALFFYYECTFDTSLNGINSEGQLIALKVAYCCLKIITCDMIPAEKLKDELSSAVTELIEYLS